MARQKKSGKYNVLRQERFGGPKAVCASGLSKKEAEEYVKGNEADSCAYEVVSANDQGEEDE